MTKKSLKISVQKKPKGKKTFTLKLHTVKGKGLAEDIQEGDWKKIAERIYKGRGT